LGGDKPSGRLRWGIRERLGNKPAVAPLGQERLGNKPAFAPLGQERLGNKSAFAPLG
jgi:hypothetical protein